jgi:hypothetical protein
MEDGRWGNKVASSSLVGAGKVRCQPSGRTGAARVTRTGHVTVPQLANSARAYKLRLADDGCARRSGGGEQAAVFEARLGCRGARRPAESVSQKPDATPDRQCPGRVVRRLQRPTVPAPMSAAHRCRRRCPTAARRLRPAAHRVCRTDRIAVAETKAASSAHVPLASADLGAVSRMTIVSTTLC